MDVLTLEARWSETVKLPQSFISQLPKQVILATTVQFIDSLALIKRQLEESGIVCSLIESRRASYPGQILGCSTTVTITCDVVYIGDGTFHPKALLLRNNTTVHAYNPITSTQMTYTTRDVLPILQRLKAGYASFLQSKTIGVFISTKSGQCKQWLVDKLKKHFPEKQYYILADDTLDFDSLENFPFLDIIVNTACERMGLDDMTERVSTFINVEDILSFANGEFDDMF